MNPSRLHLARSALRPRRLVRLGAISLLAVALVLLLPVAPAQPPRDLGTVRSARPDTPQGFNPAQASAAMAASLPYRPFIDPVRGPVHAYWYLLLIPMSFGVAVVYKAVAMQTLGRYWQQVLFMTVQIIVGMILLALGSYIVVMKYVPWIASQ